MGIQPEGRLYLYSDGLTDAGNPQREPFGKDGLIQAIEESQGQPLQQSLSSILERAQEWSCGTQVEDDISLMAVEMGE